MELKYKIIPLLFLLVFTNVMAQNVEYEQISNEVIYGDTADKIYICEGVLHNISQDTIQIEFNRVEFEKDQPFIYTALCTEIYCYTVNTKQIVEFIPPGNDYKCEMRWTTLSNNEEFKPGNGAVKWQLVDKTNSTILDTLRSKFIYAQTTSTTHIDNQIKVYPNPVSDYLNFENIESGSILEIYSAAGILLLNHEIFGARIDVNFLSQGIYYGILQSNEQRSSFRFIK